MVVTQRRGARLLEAREELASEPPRVALLLSVELLLLLLLLLLLAQLLWLRLLLLRRGRPRRGRARLLGYM